MAALFELVQNLKGFSSVSIEVPWFETFEVWNSECRQPDGSFTKQGAAVVLTARVTP